jgi:peptidoglycan hydrolase CwlO-like protein
MGVPWIQIVQLVPSIVDVSRELLKRSKRLEPATQALPANANDLAARVAALEENERRQAELVSQMAEQLAQLTRAVTVLHRRVLWLSAGITLALLAVVGTVIGLRH